MQSLQIAEALQIFAEALQIGSQKHQQNLPENCSKNTKMAITVRQISKISRGSMPPDPPKVVFVTLLV